jgi:hypothetical protein
MQGSRRRHGDPDGSCAGRERSDALSHQRLAQMPLPLMYEQTPTSTASEFFIARAEVRGLAPLSDFHHTSPRLGRRMPFWEQPAPRWPSGKGWGGCQEGPRLDASPNELTRCTNGGINSATLERASGG